MWERGSNDEPMTFFELSDRIEPRDISPITIEQDIAMVPHQEIPSNQFFICQIFEK